MLCWIAGIYLVIITKVVMPKKWEMNYINSDKMSLKEGFVNFRGN